MIKVAYNEIDKKYKFEIDYGKLKNPICTISSKDEVYVDMSCFFTNYNDEQYEQIKQDMFNQILNPMFGENEAKKLIETSTMIKRIPSAFKKAEQFIINNDLFVKTGSEETKNVEFTKEEGYSYESRYDEGTGMVTFYINSKLIPERFGIFIHEDGSFTPIESFEHILEPYAKKERQEAIKTFIKELFNIKINFGTIDGIHSLQIPKLYEKAKEYAMENGSVTYTEENGDSHVYKDKDAELIELKLPGNV